MNLTIYNLLLFSLPLLVTTNSVAQKDTIRTKDFQLIVQYDDRTIDTFEIHKIANYSSKGIVQRGYEIIIDDNYEAGPHILYTLHGQYNFIDRRGNKMCFGFQINYVSGNEYSIINSSLKSCDEQNEQTNISGYYYYLKGKLQDILQYKSSLLFVIDEKNRLRVELKIKE